ncbi:MAG: hypothetical protein HY321_02195 [Armatimonadetes bacterium]|nr:hypothetical protein [Armatimonadota bacterium]
MRGLGTKALLWCWLVIIASTCLVTQTTAEAAANPRLELLLSAAAIDNPFGPPGAPPTFYDGEGLQLKLVLANREKEPLAVGASLEQAAWVPGIRFDVTRLTPDGTEAAAGARVELIRYQPALREVKDRAPGVLHPDESIETRWQVTLNGAPPPAGQYRVVVSGQAASPFVYSVAPRVRVVPAVDRLDQLNRLHHLAVRLCWAKRFDESLAALDQLLALVPNSPSAYAEIGGVHQDSGNCEQAIAMYKRAIRIIEADELPPEQVMDAGARRHWASGLRMLVRICQQKIAQKQ